MLNRLSFPRNPFYCALLAALACGTLSVGAVAAEPGWDPAKTWTIDEATDLSSRDADNYYGANCQTASSTSSVTGDQSGYLTLVTSSSVTIPAKGLTGAYTNEGIVSGNRLEVASGTEVSLTGVSTPWGIYGGRTKKGSAEGNSVFFGGVSVSEYQLVIAGGFSTGGNATGNTTELGASAKLTQSRTQIYGGQAFSGGSANNNTLTLSA